RRVQPAPVVLSCSVAASDRRQCASGDQPEMQSRGRGRRGLCADPVATYRSQFRIGGVSVRVVGQDNDDVILVASLETFRTVTPISDIDIQVEWTDKFDPAAGRQLFDSNSVWRLYGDGADFQFDF